MSVGAELSAALVFLRPSPYPKNHVHIEKQVYTATQFKPHEVFFRTTAFIKTQCSWKYNWAATAAKLDDPALRAHNF
jgi:hypothetical protein